MSSYTSLSIQDKTLRFNHLKVDWNMTKKWLILFTFQLSEWWSFLQYFFIVIRKTYQTFWQAFTNDTFHKMWYQWSCENITHAITFTYSKIDKQIDMKVFFNSVCEVEYLFIGFNSIYLYTLGWFNIERTGIGCCKLSVIKNNR